MDSKILIIGAVGIGLWALAMNKKASAATPPAPFPAPTPEPTPTPVPAPSGTDYHTAVIDGQIVHIPASLTDVLMRKNGQNAWVGNADVPAYLAGGWIVL